MSDPNPSSPSHSQNNAQDVLNTKGESEALSTDQTTAKPGPEAEAAQPAAKSDLNTASQGEKTPGVSQSLLHNVNSADQKQGERVRKRNQIISIICAVIFLIVFYYLLKSGMLADTNRIKAVIQKAGPLGPVVFILISVFSSYVPIVPMGSMGSIGIVLFGTIPAFFYNTITSIINCLIAYWLAKRYGKRIILWFASPETVNKYEKRLQESGRFTAIFTVLMFMPVSPDLVLCMIAALSNMPFKKFLSIILISRPVSSFCYSMGLLKIVEWFLKFLHILS
ncbi:TVP38/TMEM64 family protein [Erysipelotrichaceae bacterium RD49]|nr:TVP38/TMEM64 family protein [Erysipelotrichaceae bacterium RD49]